MALAIVQAAVAGLIQGLTEFLPISSSGHLVVLHDFLNFNLPDDVAFDVVLHLGTLGALVLFFYRDIVRYAVALLHSFGAWQLRQNLDQRLAWYLLIGTAPAALVGFVWEDTIVFVFRSSALVAVMLIVFGVVLYAVDRFAHQSRTLQDITLGTAVLVGFAQAVALIPGVSRSGITIIAGLTQKLNRESAARFSFLLSIPIVFGAGCKKALDMASAGSLGGADMLLLTVGFFTALISGYACIKYFLRFLQNHSLAIFAYYRIALGLVILVVLWAN